MSKHIIYMSSQWKHSENIDTNSTILPAQAIVAIFYWQVLTWSN